MPNKIGIIIANLEVGGAERIASMQADYLHKQGYGVSLITLQDGEDHYYTRENVARVSLKKDDPYEIYSIVKKLGLDLVIDHNHWSEQHYSFFELLNKQKEKFIIVDHNSYFYPLFFDYRVSMFRRRKYIYSLADAVTTLNRHTCAMFRLELNNAVLMHNPLSYESQKIATLQDETIIAVANWTRPEKRLRYILETFSLVLKSRPNGKLLLVGPYDSVLHDLCVEYGIPSDAIEAVGRQEQVEEYYLRSSVVLLTSEVEGFGLVLTEAGMHGLPRVIMEVPGLEDVVTDGEDGFIVPDTNCQAAADKIVLLLTDRQLRQEMGTAARESTEQFKIEKVGKRWEWLIHEVLSYDALTRIKHFAEDCEKLGIDKASKNAQLKDFNRQLFNFTNKFSNVIPPKYNSSWTEATTKEMIRLALLNYRNSLNRDPISKILSLPLRQWQNIKNRIYASRIIKSGLFDESWYLAQNPDVANAGKDSLIHYLSSGIWEGRSPAKGFDPWNYLLRHQDIAASGLEPFYEYARYGQFVNRLPQNLTHISEQEKSQLPFPEDNSGASLELWCERYLSSYKNKDKEVVILHPDWRGIRSSALQFAQPEQCLFLRNDISKSDAEKITNALSDIGIKQVVFQSLCPAWGFLIEKLAKVKTRIELYCIFHGSFYQMGIEYERNQLASILNFQKRGIFQRIGLVKYGMADTLKSAGYETHFVMNYIDTIPDGPAFYPKDIPLKIGIWGREWDHRKPPYPCIAACAHIPNVELVIYGGQRASYEILKALSLKGKTTEEVKNDEMPSVLKTMYINLNVTMSECAPMLPMESLSLGVPCLFGHNNHYFDDHPYLHETLIVPQPDSEYSIMLKLRSAIEQRDEIVNSYIKYAPGYNARAKQSYFELFSR